MGQRLLAALIVPNSRNGVSDQRNTSVESVAKSDPTAGDQSRDEHLHPVLDVAQLSAEQRVMIQLGIVGLFDFNLFSHDQVRLEDLMSCGMMDLHDGFLRWSLPSRRKEGAHGFSCFSLRILIPESRCCFVRLLGGQILQIWIGLDICKVNIDLQ